MKKYRQRLVEGGGQTADTKELVLFSSIILILVIVYNLINSVSQKASITDVLLYTIPLFIFLIIINIHKSSKVLSVTFLLIGIITIMTSEYTTDFSGAVFVIMSYALFRNNKYLILILILSLISITIKMILKNVSIAGTTQMILVFGFIYYSAYVLFFKEEHKRVDISKTISERDKAILKMFANGYSYELIVKTLKLNIELSSVRKIIKRARDESNCVNDVQFGKWLYEKG